MGEGSKKAKSPVGKKSRKKNVAAALVLALPAALLVLPRVPVMRGENYIRIKESCPAVLWAGWLIWLLPLAVMEMTRSKKLMRLMKIKRGRKLMRFCACESTIACAFLSGVCCFYDMAAADWIHELTRLLPLNTILDIIPEDAFILTKLFLTFTLTLLFYIGIALVYVVFNLLTGGFVCSIFMAAHNVFKGEKHHVHFVTPLAIKIMKYNIN